MAESNVPGLERSRPFAHPTTAPTRQDPSCRYPLAIAQIRTVPSTWTSSTGWRRETKANIETHEKSKLMNKFAAPNRRRRGPNRRWRDLVSCVVFRVANHPHGARLKAHRNSSGNRQGRTSMSSFFHSFLSSVFLYLFSYIFFIFQLLICYCDKIKVGHWESIYWHKILT